MRLGRQPPCGVHNKIGEKKLYARKCDDKLHRLFQAAVQGALHQSKVDVSGWYITNKICYQPYEKGKEYHLRKDSCGCADVQMCGYADGINKLLSRRCLCPYRELSQPHRNNSHICTIMKRIISLLPAATEIVCALGLESGLVGRSHECDYPESIRHLPVCSEANFPDDLSSNDIDIKVKEILADALSVYTVKREVIKGLSPDVVIT